MRTISGRHGNTERLWVPIIFSGSPKTAGIENPPTDAVIILAVHPGDVLFEDLITLRPRRG